MPGAVHGIPGDLSHGPLDEGRARITYMGACFPGYGDWYLDVNDAFAPWRAMTERLDRERLGAVLIWNGDSVPDLSEACGACFQVGRTVGPTAPLARTLCARRGRVIG